MTPFLDLILAAFAVFVVTLIFGQVQSALASRPPKSNPET
jgi:biopolymer transport protein ExbD